SNLQLLTPITLTDNNASKQIPKAKGPLPTAVNTLNSSEEPSTLKTLEQRRVGQPSLKEQEQIDKTLESIITFLKKKDYTQVCSELSKLIHLGAGALFSEAIQKNNIS